MTNIKVCLHTRTLFNNIESLNPQGLLVINGYNVKAKRTFSFPARQKFELSCAAPLSLDTSEHAHHQEPHRTDKLERAQTCHTPKDDRHVDVGSAQLFRFMVLILVRADSI